MLLIPTDFRCFWESTNWKIYCSFRQLTVSGMNGPLGPTATIQKTTAPHQVAKTVIAQLENMECMEE